MPIEDNFGNFFQVETGIFVKSFVVLILVFYSVFALILYRQIQLMNKKLPTALSPFLKFVAIVHIGVSLALLFLVIGSF